MNPAAGGLQVDLDDFLPDPGTSPVADERIARQRPDRPIPCPGPGPEVQGAGVHAEMGIDGGCLKGQNRNRRRHQFPDHASPPLMAVPPVPDKT